MKKYITQAQPITLFRMVLAFMFIFCAIDSFGQSNRIWSSYYGGTGEDVTYSVTTDKFGNVYLAGYTNSASNIASGGFQNVYGGGLYDAFLVKLDASGNRLWATYYGGSGDDQGYKVLVDTSGTNVYLAGKTDSPNNIAFGGFQNVYGGGQFDGFVVKFDAATGNRIWGTYYGDTGFDPGYGAAIDRAGNVYLVGSTQSSSNIAVGGFQTVFGGFQDAYLVKFDPTGNRVWSTYYGASSLATSAGALATDTLGNIYLAGHTRVTSGMAAGGHQNAFGGGQVDAFVVKFDATTGNRIWATYYGGNGDELGFALITDLVGNVYLAGSTNSNNNISSTGFQNIYGGSNLQDAYLVKFNTGGTRLWATYYGGSSDDFGYNSAIDSFGNIYLGGETSTATAGVIASGGFQNTLIGTKNQYVVKFDSLGNRLCATYYGQLNEQRGAVNVDNSGNVYLGGRTTSASNIASGGFQTVFGGGVADGSIVKLSSCCPINVTNQNVTICAGTTHTLPWGAVVGTSGTYSDTTALGGGCDSIANVILTVTTITVTMSDTICAGATYTLPWGPVVSNAGSYSDTVTVGGGCDSVTIVTLTVSPTITFVINATICAGNTYTLPWGPVVGTAGSYSDTMTTSGGCDSITIVNLTINPAPITTLTPTICFGSSYSLPWGGTASNSGTYSDTLTTFNGCDSIVNVILTVSPIVSITQNATICSGDTYQLPDGTTISAAGTYTTILHSTTNVCDTSITTNLTVNPAPVSTQTAAICEGQPFVLPSGIIVNSTGIYTDTLSTLAGCDSIVITDLTVKLTGTVTIPNVFTPNNDGKNDFFYLEQLDCIETFNINIYNRWGIKIFESDKVTVDWDGRVSSGMAAKDGVYYYILKIKTTDGKEVEKTGFITLLR